MSAAHVSGNTSLSSQNILGKNYSQGLRSYAEGFKNFLISKLKAFRADFPALLLHASCRPETNTISSHWLNGCTAWLGLSVDLSSWIFYFRTQTAWPEISNWLTFGMQQILYRYTWTLYWKCSVLHSNTLIFELFHCWTWRRTYNNIVAAKQVRMRDTSLC